MLVEQVRKQREHLFMHTNVVEGKSFRVFDAFISVYCQKRERKRKNEETASSCSCRVSGVSGEHFVEHCDAAMRIRDNVQVFCNLNHALDLRCHHIDGSEFDISNDLNSLQSHVSKVRIEIFHFFPHPPHHRQINNNFIFIEIRYPYNFIITTLRVAAVKTRKWTIEFPPSNWASSK